MRSIPFKTTFLYGRTETKSNNKALYKRSYIVALRSGSTASAKLPNRSWLNFGFCDTNVNIKKNSKEYIMQKAPKRENKI